MPEAQQQRIRPRRVRFDWTDMPLHWVPGDPFATHVVNVLHLLLPAGERWFCKVFRKVLPSVTDESVRDDVRGFIGQEAVHARAHAAVLEHLAAQGIDTRPYTRRVEWLFDRLLGDHPLGERRWLRPLAGYWLASRLAIIAAIEHLTCVLGSWVLEATGLDEAGADPTMLDLLRWHAAEEVEHRSVAFDLSRHLGASYVRRVLAMAIVFPALVWLWIVGTRFLMRHDPSLGGAKPRWRDFVRAGRKGRVPTTGHLLRAVPRYLRPGHHPSQEGSIERALAYLVTSPAAGEAG